MEAVRLREFLDMSKILGWLGLAEVDSSRLSGLAEVDSSRLSKCRRVLQHARRSEEVGGCVFPFYFFLSDLYFPFALPIST